MAIETSFLIEEEEDELATTDGGDRLLAILGRARSTGIVPLAFTIEEDLEPRISWRMGLETYALDPARQDAEPFIYLETLDTAATQHGLRSLLDNWIVTFLVPQYIEPGGVSFQLRDDLLALSHADRIVRIESIADQLLPWTSGPTGTASPPNRKRGFQLLVDQAARHVAGKELFRGLGPVLRIVTAGAYDQSKAQLITQPIELGERGQFSLVVTLEVVTFPSLGQPLITVEVSKRRWLSRISERAADRNAISGSVFSSRRPERAVAFSVSRERGPDGNWHWMPDNAYEALKPALGLPLLTLDAQGLLRGEADTADSRVRLVHRDSISAGRHRIKVGVPELDKLEAFDHLTQALAPIGLVPFRSYAPVATRHSKDHEEAAKTINPSTLLSAALEALDTEKAESPSDGFLATLDDEQIDQLLFRHFKIGLDQIQKGQRIVRHQNVRGTEEKNQRVELETLIRANTDAVRRMYGDTPPLLVIFHDEKSDAALRIVKAVARLLWGDAIEIQANRLPPGTHGSRQTLPRAEQKDRERSDLRVEAWRPFAQQLAAMKRRTFCLVMAPDHYPDPSDSAQTRRDDRINKGAGRQALATFAQASVQYLLPPNVARDGDHIDLGDFLHRIQAALRDLISAHSGRFEGVAQAVVRSFSAVPAMRDSMPKEILGITVVRKIAGRAHGAIGTTFLPIALRIDVQTGRCEARCAYEGRSGDLAITGWESFAAALSTVSRISPVRLAEKMETARTRFERFTEQIISESVDADTQPVVLIDSSNCVRLWPWLADQRLHVGNIQIGEKQWMEKAWKGARIVRIRQNLAPGIVESKEQRCAYSSIEDSRDRDTLPCDLTLETPTSPVGLFRLTSVHGQTGAACYLSVGRKVLHMEKRGPSCYRETKAALPYKKQAEESEGARSVRNQADLPLYALGTRMPWVGQWPTPIPIEIVVTLRQPGDDADRIAELVERLRYGFGHYADWTSLPAPLFFERVVRDYVSGFAFEDATEPEDDA
jgi:hypothetical protein